MFVDSFYDCLGLVESTGSQSSQVTDHSIIRSTYQPFYWLVTGSE